MDFVGNHNYEERNNVKIKQETKQEKNPGNWFFFWIQTRVEKVKPTTLQQKKIELLF